MYTAFPFLNFGCLFVAHANQEPHCIFSQYNVFSSYSQSQLILFLTLRPNSKNKKKKKKQKDNLVLHFTRYIKEKTLEV